MKLFSLSIPISLKNSNPKATNATRASSPHLSRSEQARY